LSQNFWLPT